MSDQLSLLEWQSTPKARKRGPSTSKSAARPVQILGEWAVVPLTKGYVAVIDAQDAHLAADFNWAVRETRRCDGTVTAAYAMRKEPRSLGETTVYLHRQILGAPAGLHVDHIDGNGLNNCRSNLRLATPAQNQHNGRKRIDNSSGAKGVSQLRQSGRWRAYIFVGGKQKSLGHFDTKAEAAEAYANACRQFYGDFGRVE